MADNLEQYRKKRSAGGTPEPVAQVRPSQATAAPLDGRLTYVMQKHNATRLHWDLRLELDGVLKSWAVPKGPSYDQADKVLAVQTEDHPIEYADFEGVIPKGNYGAGEMIVWDRGTFTWVEDPHAGFAKGKLLFDLHGHKLRGRWTLVKIKKAEVEWLLIKERDGLQGAGRPPLPDDSVLSGRTLEDLKTRGDPSLRLRDALAAAGALRRTVHARDVSLMLATAAARPFSSPDWLYELKYDGYRMLVERDGGTVRMLSRNGNDLAPGFPDIAAAVLSLPCPRFIIDGEVVVQDDAGMPRFQLLQKRARVSSPREIAHYAATLPATLYVFDLIAFEDHDARPLPLTTRKELLRLLLPSTGTLRYSEHVAERGVDFFAAAEAMGLEGMVAKRADASYRGGRSGDWLKVRVHRSGDFAIVGFKKSSRARGFGSFHVAAWRDDVLTYAGSVGTGVTASHIDHALAQTAADVIAKPACTAVPASASKEDVWVEPRLVCEVRYLEWTAAGNLRHPVFLGFRPDKPVPECVADVADAELADGELAADSAADESVELGASGVRATRATRSAASRKGADTGSDDVARETSGDVKFSNLDKIYWPEDGYTKGDMIEYYRSIAPLMLRYLRDRPVVLTRFPDGIHGKSFFQKHAPGHTPPWLRTETMWSDGSERDLSYFVADDERSLLYLANSGSIPLHIWSSRVATLQHPDWCVLDLDPKEAPFTDVVKVALALRELCDGIGLPSYVKTSGSSGLHVMLPMGRLCTHDQTRVIGELVARQVVKELPEIATITRVVSKRAGRVYVDYLQNGHGKLLVAPYCVRALPGAPVSTPLEWREVNPKLDIRKFTIRTVPPRVKKLKDPIAQVMDDAPDLVRVLGALQKLGGHQ